MDDQDHLIMGFALGIVMMVIVWMFSALIMEESKVNSGFLTLRSEIYKVEYVGSVTDKRLELTEQCKPKEQD